MYTIPGIFESLIDHDGGTCVWNLGESTEAELGVVG